MFIKDIIIDGFKSYGRRTEISKLDPEFTAITGLNGTGKSNILDSICFVLGISKLGQVRATSLQDLIYKNGQAGVIRASVTLIFDNTNSEQCPIGYEKCREISVARQIAVGGKNKYLINGKNVQAKKVEDFFCSLQLNVNNPNFLIMQGRIMKVLNMKPQEVLSMIEEAAGTSVYETKREATTKLIEKKESKVRESGLILAEEVEPKLEKLRSERQAYQDYQKICRDIEFLTRICISDRYLKQQEALNKTDGNLNKINTRIEAFKQKIEENAKENQNIIETCKAMEEKIEKHATEELKPIEEQLKTKSTEHEVANFKLKELENCIDQEETKIKRLQKEINKDENSLKDKQKKMSQAEELFKGLKDADENDSKALEEARRVYDAISQGLSADKDGQASSLTAQLMSAQQQHSEAKTSVKEFTMQLKHYRSVLQDMERKTKAHDKEYENENNISRQLQSRIVPLETEIGRINYEDGAFESLRNRKNGLQREIQQLENDLRSRGAARFELQYQDPEPNFDRSKVHGIVGKLFDLPDKDNSMALMITAGGQIYSHVVDDDDTGTKILQNGRLQRRVTLIPINKITGRSIDPSVVSLAKNMVGQENVHEAISLINYDKYFEPVMKFVFGGSFVCRDINDAKKVTFNSRIRRRCVTLEGDVVDPEGTLSGGSKPSGINIIEELSILRDLEQKIQQKKAELDTVCRELSRVESVARLYNEKKRELDLLQHELKNCQSRLAQTSFQKGQDELSTLKENIRSTEENLKCAEQKITESSVEVKDLTDKLNDQSGYRERQLKEAEKNLKLAKEKAEKSKKLWKNREEEYESLQLEIEVLSKSIATSNESRREIEENLAVKKTELKTLQINCAKIAAEVASLSNVISENKAKLHDQSNELKSLGVKREHLKNETANLEYEINKKKNEVTKLTAEQKEFTEKIKDLEKKYPWILEDREYFGTKNTRYDYSKENPAAASSKLTKLKDQKSKMERTLNMNAMMLLEREEENYNKAIQRKTIVRDDKAKIEGIIKNMDQQKQEQLDTAWKQVNQNFSSIFSTLLSGAQAGLEPVTQKNVLIGLKIKVGFNGIWKESLNELSGGQRSLVALSLVLAMLKFSPAPLYILDEIDAALDMSHTQNIGQMLKEHFTNSQFIIVSLKDGMFNNANVLFRTKFEDGVSGVTRQVNPRLTKKN